MGTPQFSIPVLEALLVAGHQAVGVVTQPDKPAGRGRQGQVSPVKRFALERDLTVLQPPSLRPREVVEGISSLAPDVVVVAAYGKILPASLLGLPPLGALNLHPSLLPRHRGPSPVASAILEGDEFTGVTVMHMDEGMDTGPVLAQEEEPILPEDTTETLTWRLFRHGASLFVRTLEKWGRQEVRPVLQDSANATISRIVRKEDGTLDFNLPADRLWRQVRAYQPWPGAYTRWEGRLLKVLEAVPLPPTEEMAPPRPGQVVALFTDAPAPAAVDTGRGLLGLRRLQLEGKRPVSCQEFLRGYPAFPGSRLPS